jgi:cyclic lactone autoinducer peptide
MKKFSLIATIVAMVAMVAANNVASWFGWNEPKAPKSICK